MQSIKRKARIRPDTTLELIEPLPNLPPGEIEIIVLFKDTEEDLQPQEHAPSEPHVGTQQTNQSPHSPSLAELPCMEWSDKSGQIYWINRVFETLGITGTPIGIEELQQLMGASGLEENELSRDLIAMRDE